MNKKTHLYFVYCLLILSISSSCSFDTSKTPNVTVQSEKQKGVHLFAYLDSIDFQPLKQTNIEWLTLVPWGFQRDYDSPEVSHHNGDSLAILHHDSVWVSQIQMAHQAGFKVFFKPHVWLNEPSNGTWRSDIFPSNDTDWDLWQASYRDFILRYAKIAEKAGAEQFCIGTEFSRLTIEKPEYWQELIQDVRAVYSGKLTYAANWYNEYEQISFWKALDFIGIQAYFPLVEKDYPSVEEISEGWGRHLSAIESIHQKYQRQVIFTEMGYKSMPNSATKPWEWMDYETKTPQAISLETQSNCYTAFFNTVWSKEWMAGVHIWQWRGEYEKNGGEDNLDFTPQRKPAEKVIAAGFLNKI